MLKLLAFDYGASSGRTMLGSFDGSKLQIREIHRYQNDPVWVMGTFQWDLLRLFHEMKQGIQKCINEGTKDINGIGVDTWGVDFGLLDANGELLSNPCHYRDSRTDNMIELACSIVPKREIYEQTGTQFMKFNTLYQLLGMKTLKSQILNNASTMLFMPDLFNYLLTGIKVSEFSITSTSQMYNPKEKVWAKDLLSKLDLPQNILCDIVNPCTVLGEVGSWIKDELNINNTKVIAVAGHDTGSAVASVPVTEEKFAYLSSGTWSLLGVESKTPIINDTTFELDYTNEGGVEGTFRILKNIMGLWIYQECKRAWDKSGDTITFDELEELAFNAEPFASLIDPDSEEFFAPGHMSEKIIDFCRRTNQKIPNSKGAIVRCIMESLALKYRMALEGLQKITGNEIPVLHIIGGGCKNTVLCQFTANAIKKPVIAGPIEATAIGNIVCQLIALGEVKNLKEARMLVKNSFPTTDYLPQNSDSWDEAFQVFKEIVIVKK